MGCSGFVSCTVAYKYGKVFLPEEQPWKITFNSISTALEREERESLESSANVAGTLAGILATIDQDFGVTDKRAFLHFVWTDVLKRDEESFELFAPKRGLQKGRRRRRTARIWWTGTTSRGTAYIENPPAENSAGGFFWGVEVSTASRLHAAP